jgi:hypothetical protein
MFVVFGRLVVPNESRSILKLVSFKGIAWEPRHLREKFIEAGFPHHSGI